ncbi:MAG: protein-glutamate O-methyltransferase CheR [Gemmatimonadetes bacterium]|nr:protein-glutamate O-methyltransferase CheR [Gemmatimonadota bacterium]
MNPTGRLSTEALDAAAALVRRLTGLVFSEARRSAFESALVGAMQRARLRDPEAYLARLAAKTAALDDLVGEITVGETYFFREPQQFALIRDHILPSLRKHLPRGRALRLWCAGCASGEEPYTVAIVLHELGLEHEASIMATDLSRPALLKARQARYGRWSLRATPEEFVERYFTRIGDQVEPALSVRRAVEFGYLNLADDTYPSLATGIWGMDLILCRNVLIYFDAQTVAHVARQLLASLSPEGWLLLGASDPPLGGIAPCVVVPTNAGLAYRRSEATAPAALLLPPPPAPWPVAVQEPAPFPPVPARASPPDAVEEPLPAPAMRAPTSDLAAHIDEASDDVAAAARWYAERDYERAGELAARAVGHDGGDPAPWTVLVRALANQGRLDAAGLACAAALDRHRTSAELAYLHAVLLTEAGHYGEAAAAARRALYLDRGLVVGHLALGGALVRLGNAGGARRAFRNAERLLASIPPEQIVPASDGEPAARLAEMARVQVHLLSEAAA